MAAVLYIVLQVTDNLFSRGKARFMEHKELTQDSLANLSKKFGALQLKLGNLRS